VRENELISEGWRDRIVVRKTVLEELSESCIQRKAPGVGAHCSYNLLVEVV
jgi:hypothetical protein